MKIDFSSKLFLSVLTISVIAVVIATGYKFLWLRDYNFIVEASCDPTSQTCFVRDCSNPDDCPPNGFENYSVYGISATDFSQCTDNSCSRECKMNVISCLEISCGEAEEDECSVPEILTDVTTTNTASETIDSEGFEEEINIEVQ